MTQHIRVVNVCEPQEWVVYLKGKLLICSVLIGQHWTLKGFPSVCRCYGSSGVWMCKTLCFLSRRRTANSLSTSPENTETPSGGCAEVRVPSTALHSFVSTAIACMSRLIDGLTVDSSKIVMFDIWVFSPFLQLQCVAPVCVCAPSGSPQWWSKCSKVQPWVPSPSNRRDRSQGEAVGGDSW